MDALLNIENELKHAVSTDMDEATIQHIRESFFDKKGRISQAMAGMHLETADQKPIIGKKVNELKTVYLPLIDDKLKKKQADNLHRDLANQAIDITLPGKRPALGSWHPIRRAEHELVAIGESMGFSVVYGPIIEDMFHNFDALNIPATHPARDMHDTFYLSRDAVLRTHTSSVQIRHMRQNRPPITIMAPGPVFRSDQDRTHSPMFHQLEGLHVDRGVTLPDLKRALSTLLTSFFNGDFPIRYRSSYFPFTEPSFEVDIQTPNGEWMEVLGAGMVHRQVLRAVDIDPDVYTGFAFGLGIDRLAMIKFGVTDIRDFYDNDTRFLRQGV